MLVRQLDLYAHMISAETDMLKVTMNTEISRLTVSLSTNEEDVATCRSSTTNDFCLRSYDA